MMIGADDLVTCRIGQLERMALMRRAQYAVPIQVQDRAAVVHFDEPQSAALFASRYRDLPAHDRTDIRAYAVRDRSGQTHFWTDQAVGYTWPHGPLGPPATAFLADAVAMHAMLIAIPSAIALHAAALHSDGRAFGITGHSTAGKSTTAVACVAAGCELYSDERCIITPAGTLPFPRALNLRRGGIDLLIADLPIGGLRSRLELHRGANWDDVHFDELFEPRARLPPPARLGALFTVGGLAATPRSRRISAVEMLPRAQLGAITAATGIDRASVLLKMLQGVACYELVLGSPCASARHILDVLARDAPA
jgi:hypothetical protein